MALNFFAINVVAVESDQALQCASEKGASNIEKKDSMAVLFQQKIDAIKPVMSTHDFVKDSWQCLQGFLNDQSAVVQVTMDQNFDDIVMKSNKPVIVIVYAQWCSACLMFKPIYENIAKKYKDQIVFATIDIDKAYDFAVQYTIRSMPTWMLFMNGQCIASRVGAVLQNDLDRFVLDIIQVTQEQI